MQRSLLILLLVIALSMITLSIQNAILAPGLTGIGFLIIALLFKQKS
ncbi:hypothetical protein SPBRAN_1993 [uncultured Candidatus Thioglobus sp.]|nr:hypothetical protein SPBRAN_1993 [uncultured Candidatus Thioglobus sp.]